MAVYNSNYTGAQVDAAVGKVSDITKTAAQINDLNQVNANPILAGTEADLTGLEVGSTKYKVPQPINVVANPTLAGTEADLEGLQVGDTKYKIPSGGGNLFSVSFSIKNNNTAGYLYLTGYIISNSVINSKDDLYNYIIARGANVSGDIRPVIPVSGISGVQTRKYICISLSADNNEIGVYCREDGLSTISFITLSDMPAAVYIFNCVQL